MYNRITIKDIASQAKVSTTTVSNVINGTGRVSTEKMEIIKRIINANNYSPSIVARSLKDKKTFLIAIIVPFFKKGEIQDNPFYWEFLAGAESGARDHHFNIIFTGLDDDMDISFINNRYLDGLIVLGTYEGSLLLQKLETMNIPCVFVDSYLKSCFWKQVLLDDKTGGRLGTEYLISLGHKRIALICDKLSRNSVNHERWIGYRIALEEANIQYDPELVFETPVTIIGGYNSVNEILRLIKGDKSVSAVFAFSDVAAIGLIKRFSEIGVNVPGDLSVMGFDDISISQYTIPTLTSIRQDIYKKGQEAVRILLETIIDKKAETKDIVLSVQLVIRKSTAKFICNNL